MCSRGEGKSLANSKSTVAHLMELSRHKQCGQSARVRLSVFPEKDRTGFVIEAVKLDDALNRWPGLGQTLGVYTGGRKAMDALAQLKSSSYLLYRLAAQHATTQGWEDALVLNTADRIAESSRANLFYHQE